jgi:hypothetical protein
MCASDGPDGPAEAPHARRADLGLAPIRRRIFGTVQAINGRGVTVLLVEQNVQALALAHRGCVLEWAAVLGRPPTSPATSGCVRRISASDESEGCRNTSETSRGKVAQRGREVEHQALGRSDRA